jgi:hypothetical protein
MFVELTPNVELDLALLLLSSLSPFQLSELKLAGIIIP